MIKIIKRRGKEESFDERKVYASCYEACVSSGKDKQKAEEVCDSVTNTVKSWIGKKEDVTSDAIFVEEKRAITLLDKEAGEVYEEHRNK